MTFPFVMLPAKRMAALEPSDAEADLQEESGGEGLREA